MGFGANTRAIHTFKIERLSEDMPLVIEIVDTKEKLEAFLELIDPHIKAGLVTLEKATEPTTTISGVVDLFMSILCYAATNTRGGGGINPPFVLQ